MTLKEKIMSLRNDGTLAEMYRAGLITHKPIYYIDIVVELESKGLTQIALARRLGVSRKVIQRAVKTFK